MLETMDRAGVKIMGILGHNVDPFQTIESIHENNTFTRDLIKGCPERFFGFAFINPNLPKKIVTKELDHWLAQPEFRGIKLEFDTPCRDKTMDTVMERAAAHNAVVLQHTWYFNTWNADAITLERQAGRSEAHDLADLARRFPEVRIIMAHLEGSGIRGVLDVADLSNVWIDTSGSQPFTGTLDFALETVGSHRILFGSDYFGRSMATQIGRILGSRATPEDCENIFHRNARNLFSL